MDPTIPVLYVNRGMCWKKRADWERVLADASKALQLEPNNMKVRLVPTNKTAAAHPLTARHPRCRRPGAHKQTCSGTPPLPVG